MKEIRFSFTGLLKVLQKRATITAGNIKSRIVFHIRETINSWKKMVLDGDRYRARMPRRKIPLGYRIEAGIIGTAVVALAEAGALSFICTVLWLLKAPPFTPEEWANGLEIVLPFSAI